MAKFQAWKDMFDFNKRLMDFDWNDGQAYTVEYKIKKEGYELKNTAKVGEGNNGHKVGLESKVKFNADFANGFDAECKIKNNGELVGEFKSNYLKQFEGFDGVQLAAKVTNGTKSAPMQVGMNFNNASFIYSQMFQTAGNYGMTSTGAYRVTDSLTFGWDKTWKSATNPMGDCAWQTAIAAQAGSSIQYGMLLGGYSETIATTKVNDATMYFQHTTDKWGKSATVGSQMKYDVASKKFDTKLGLHLHLDDHSWKVRVHDTGMMRAALMWKLHQACKVNVNTSVDLKDAFNGKVNKLPINLTFEVAY